MAFAATFFQANMAERPPHLRGMRSSRASACATLYRFVLEISGSKDLAKCVRPM